MKGRVQKWGNSLAVRVPKGVAEEARLEHGSQVEISVHEGAILIAPLSRPRYRLDTLLAGVTPENVHEATDWGEAQGREVW